MTLRERFGRNVITIRKQAGLSQEQLGYLAGLHRTEIGMIERGTRLVRIDTLIKLAGALEVTPDELLDGIGWTPGSVRSGHFRSGAEPET